MRPSYKLPSRNGNYPKKLIPAEYDRVKSAVEKATNSADFLALSSDGWSDISGNRLINVIVLTPTPYLHSTIDATLEAHTGEYISDLLAIEVEKLGKILKLLFLPILILGPQKIISIVTDNAANMKKAWKLLNKKYPWIIFEGCKAHSVDLAAKDLCKTQFISSIVDQCVEIAKFFR